MRLRIFSYAMVMFILVDVLAFALFFYASSSPGFWDYWQAAAGVTLAIAAGAIVVHMGILLCLAYSVYLEFGRVVLRCRDIVDSQRPAMEEVDDVRRTMRNTRETLENIMIHMRSDLKNKNAARKFTPGESG